MIVIGKVVMIVGIVIIATEMNVLNVGVVIEMGLGTKEKMNLVGMSQQEVVEMSLAEMRTETDEKVLQKMMRNLGEETENEVSLLVNPVIHPWSARISHVTASLRKSVHHLIRNWSHSISRAKDYLDLNQQ